MAIDRTGISSLNTGAGEITYSGNQGPKSPDQMLMAQADPMLVEEYEKYVFEMEEMGRQPISFREFIQEIMSGMAKGGRAGYTRGGGVDYMPTDPGSMGNPAVVGEKMVGDDMREFRITNPDIEDVADYKSYYERLKRLKELMEKRMIPMSKAMEPPVYSEQDYPQFGPGMPFYQMPELNTEDYAYGGTARPTYTQSRKQRMAGGGIAGLRQIGKPVGIVEPGISGYGFFDFLDPVKDFVMEKAVPTVMDFFGKGKDVITKMPQGSPGQLNPLKDVISKMPQASPIQMAKDAMRGSPIQMAKDAAKQVVTKMPQGSPFQLNKPIEDLAKQYSLVNDPFVGDQDLSDEAKEAAEMAQGPDPYRNIFDTGAISFPKPSAEKEGGIWDAIKTGASNVWDWGTEQFGTQDPYVKDGETIYPVNWKGPLAIGTAAGAAQAAMPKAKLPQDTSGIDIANIRSRALTG